MHVEDYIRNLSPIRQNINSYPMENNNRGDDYSMSLIDDGHFCDTIINENKDLSTNDITESRYQFISSLHVGDAKYRIKSSKTEHATNITIHKMTEMIESNKTFEVTGDELSIHSLINIKCTVILAEAALTTGNKPHSMRLVFCYNNVRYSQLKTEAPTYHYL